MDLKILLLDDRDPESVLASARDAINLLPVERSNPLQREWEVKLGANLIQLRLQCRSSIEDIDKILQPQTKEQTEDRDAWDLILLDNAWEQKGGNARTGLDHLLKYRWKPDNAPLLALYTAHADFDASYVHQALTAGASSVVKKQEPVHLVNLICFAVERKQRRLQLLLGQREVEGILKDPVWANRIVARSAAMKSMLAEIVASANYEQSVVVIEGEIGTGKTLLAELMHGVSRRAKGPFVKVFIGQTNAGTFNDELAGAVKGAQAGSKPRRGLLDIAAQGTILFDELQSASPQHIEVLKALVEQRAYRPVGHEGQLRPCTARLVFATNKGLEDLCSEGKLGWDFISRVDQIRLRVPSLQDRQDDILDLALNAARRWCIETQSPLDPPTISAASIDILKRTVFPDNVRGLINATTKACRRAGLASELLPEHFEDLATNHLPAPTSLTSSDYLLLARIGPRDRSSQRTVFDALIARSPDALPDDDLLKLIGGDSSALQVVITRLRSRLTDTDFEIVRDQGPSLQGYRLSRKGL